MNGEEILSHRKKKFLSIGRHKGFKNNNSKLDTLTGDKTDFDFYKSRIINKYSIFFLLAFVAIISYFLL